MLPNINPEKTKSWSQLHEHYKSMRFRHLNDLFAEDNKRFENFSLRWNNMLFDFSKNRVNATTLDLLTALADETKLKEAIAAMFKGDPINETELRAVLHTALRKKEGEEAFVGGENVVPEVHAVLNQMKAFSDKIITGEYKGYTNKPITDVVQIGIGGSHLGPFTVLEALKPYQNPNIRVQFISNVDAAAVETTLAGLNPETTLFIIASKSFTTKETMKNAQTARAWFLDEAVSEEFVAKHFVALSTNTEKVKAFGISEDNIFRFWDWVGGRFSVWSAIGLPVCCSIGFNNFRKFLDGAREMDYHFEKTPFRKNIPVMAALLSIWYNNFFGAETEAVIPYDENLKFLPQFLQQLAMESNGKTIDRKGMRVGYQTGNITWGAAGTDAQHSFFQLLHQGSKLVPCDFIAPVNSHYSANGHHEVLLANCFAQSEALMKGKDRSRVMEELMAKGLDEDEVLYLTPFKTFEGNRPSNTFLLEKITPEALGSLLAMYEHKVFVQGIILNIFSFDQWGVELGKQLAKPIEKELKSKKPAKNHDGSTNNLIRHFIEIQKKKEAEPVG